MNRARTISIGATLLLVALLFAGCHAGKLIAPSPPMRAISTSDVGVDIEFGEPLLKWSAEDKSHYQVHPVANPAASFTIYSATLVDTAFGRVVQLLLPDGLPDSGQYEISASGVLALDGRSTGVRVVTFHSGLSYRTELRDLFDTHCSGCHGASQAGGNYRTDSYDALLGGGSDATPNLLAGNPRCALVTRIKPLRKMFDLGGLSYLDFETIYYWVVSYQARR